MQQALQNDVALQEGLEDRRCWEGLMEVKADVCLDLLKLPNVVGDEHALISVDPDGLRIDHLSHLVDPLGQPRVELLEGVPLL